MSKCSKCQNDFTPLIKNNGLPYKTCDICRCTSNKYKDTHKEYTKEYGIYYRELNTTLPHLRILAVVTPPRRGVRGSTRESVLFIGTQFSNLYTAVDTPAKGRGCCGGLGHG